MRLIARDGTGRHNVSDAKRKILLGIGAGVLLVALGVIVGVLVTGGDDEPPSLAGDGAVGGTTSAESSEPESPEPPGNGPDTTYTTPPPVDVDTREDGRHFTYVRELASVGGATQLVVDYAQMLTGAEAAAAASAAGEESPPPNDYFIVNENALLRTLPVDTALDVRLTSLADGTDPAGYDVPFGTWEDMFVGMIADAEFVRTVPYWITVEGGTITAIEEQYLP